MNITRILEQRDGSIYTCHLTQGVAEVAQLLADRRIGALPVMDGDTVVGIFSERDLLYCVAKEGAAALDKPVSAFMTHDVIFAEPGETVDSLLGRMTDRRVRHLPVCVEERLVGIISIGDLVKWKISEVEAEADGLKAYIATG